MEDWRARDAPVPLARTRPFVGVALGYAQRDEPAPFGADAFPLLPANLPQSPTEPLVEPLEYAGRVGEVEVRRPPDAVAVDLFDPPLHRDAPTTGGQLAQASLGPFQALRVHPHLDLAAAVEEAKPQQGPLHCPVNDRFLAVDLEL